ncbi:hypothetical protein, partial [Bacillus subtilis]|uniref:hypothetical protein n=1 Tax=Bacillus subtilis TaxID=1423 RepID=UPI001643489C
RKGIERIAFWQGIGDGKRGNDGDNMKGRVKRIWEVMGGVVGNETGYEMRIGGNWEEGVLGVKDEVKGVGYVIWEKGGDGNG